MKSKTTLIRNLYIFISECLRHGLALRLWIPAWRECQADHGANVRRELNALTMESELTRRIDEDGEPVYYGMSHDEALAAVRERLYRRTS